VLFGKGAVHGLDGAEHRRRKQLFLDVLTEERVAALGDDVRRELAERVMSWPDRTPFSLFDELARVYGTCVVPWAGVLTEPGEAAVLAQTEAWIVDGFGFAPTAYTRACWARWSADRWARRVVREARQGHRPVPPGTMLAALATGPGASLPVDVAGVELVNVVRPTVAVAWLGSFALLELVRRPEVGSMLAQPAASVARRHFADEVRRTAPFVPALAGRCRRGTTWHGRRIAEGDFVVLDVPGTNHVSWDDPEQFRPERFAERTPSPYELVPQGGGITGQGHRCPGEQVAMTLLDQTLQQVASTSLTISTSDPDLTRIPTLPGGGVRVVAVGLPADAIRR